jgi:hypothetical protein
MIILVVHENRILALKQKSQSPIPTNAHCPMSLKVATKCVQAVTGSIHIGGRASCIQRGEQISEFFRMRGLDSRLWTRLWQTIAILCAGSSESFV